MMKRMRLGDICNFVNGKAFKPSEWEKEGLPIVRIQNLNDDKAEFNYCNKKIEDKYIIQNNQLLFSWSGTPGTSFGAFFWMRGKAVLNQHIFKVIPKINVNIEYLKYLLNGNLDIIISKSHGGVGLQHITKGELEKITVNIHEIEEQEYIVKSLNAVAEIITNRKEQMKKFEEIIKSQFVEMFGSVELNDKKFEEQEMSRIADISSSKRIYANEYQEIGIPFYRSKEIIELGHNKKPSIELFISKSRYEEIKDKYGIPKKGDILITAVGTIGETWIVDTDEPFYYKDGNVLQIRLNTDISQIYFKYVLDTLISIFKNKNVSGSAYSALTIEKFKKMKIILPPIELQNQFADIVKQIDKQKFEIEKSLNEMQELYESLMEKYFG